MPVLGSLGAASVEGFSSLYGCVPQVVNTTTFTTSTLSPSTSASIAHSVANLPNRALVISVASEADTAANGVVSSITYNGIVATQILGGTAENDGGLGGVIRTEMWMLLSPPTGTFNLLIDFPASSGLRGYNVGITTVVNVKQTTNVAALSRITGTDGVNGFSNNYTVTRPNTLFLSVIAHLDTNGAFAATSGQTIQYNIASAACNSALGTLLAPVGTQNVTWAFAEISGTAASSSTIALTSVCT